MKQVVITMVDERQPQLIIAKAKEYPLDGSVECVFRNAKVGKTLAQLGTLFGIWLEEIEDQTGGSWTIETLHNYFKHKFLVQIYMKEQQGPHASKQEQWAEHLELLLEKGDSKRIERHIKRISLSWISKEQHSEYLDRIWNFSMDQGFRLTIPDKYHKVYRRELERMEVVEV